jgi:hypothetical protein
MDFMIKIKSITAWAILCVLGVILLFMGMLGYIGIFSFGDAVSTVILGMGVILIVEATIFIRIEMNKIAKEIAEHERLKEICKDSADVPDDLKSGYIIDLTAEPSRAITYENDPECGCEVSYDEVCDDPCDDPCDEEATPNY